MAQLGSDIWAYAVLAVVLIIAAVTDLRSGKIYNWTTYPAMLIGLVGHAVIGGLWGDVSQAGKPGCMGLVDSLLGLAIGAGPLLAVRFAGGMGGGDVKVMGAIGALAGWRFALSAMFYGFAIAAILAMLIMIRKRIVRDTLGRIGRFIFLLFVRMKPGDPATPESPKLAFGLALCIGAMLALVLVCVFGPNEKMFLLGV